MTRYSLEVIGYKDTYEIEFESADLMSINALLTQIIISKLSKENSKVIISPTGYHKLISNLELISKQNVIPDLKNKILYCYELGEYIDLEACDLNANPIAMLCLGNASLVNHGFPLYNGFTNQYLGRWVNYHIGLIEKNSQLLKNSTEIEVYLL